jgi:hypothetical protein
MNCFFLRSIHVRIFSEIGVQTGEGAQVVNSVH